MTARVGRAAAAVAAVLLMSGCASRQGFTSRFVKPGEPALSIDGPPAEALGAQAPEDPRKLREPHAKAVPRMMTGPTVESGNPVLAAALQRLAFVESAENHRRVAAAYRQVGVGDFAYRHFRHALRFDSCDSAAHQGLAQLWRDWGVPHLALGDAYRALHCSPDSAGAHNTLGTVLQALGEPRLARQAFDRALQLDDVAVFALNNLCYLSLMEGNGEGAQRECERALALAPAMTPARNNLALAHAIQGDIEGAERRFLDSRDPAEGQYNVGILRMSIGQHAGAVDAFDRALATNPSLRDARRRAAQARTAAAGQREQ